MHENDNEYKYNRMKASYKSLNKIEKVTIKHFYHILCYPELGLGYYTMRRISLWMC